MSAWIYWYLLKRLGKLTYHELIWLRQFYFVIIIYNPIAQYNKIDISNGF